MSPRVKKPEAEVYSYRWCGDYETVISDRTTPGGSGVLAKPGEVFQTTEPLDHFLAEPVDGDAPPKGEQSSDGEGGDTPSEEGSA